MKKQCFVNFMLAGMSLNDYGLEIPSPFSSLQLSNSQIASMTSWKLECIVGGDANRKINIAAFEALLYSAAQAATKYETSSGIPVSFIYGWLDDNGNVAEYASYQGFTINFKVGTNGLYMTYTLEGYAQLAIQSSMPVLNIPPVRGIVQPSAVLEGLAIGLKATNYYELDIDHNDVPTYVNHGNLTTSFNRYVRGGNAATDDYDSFPGLLKLSKSYNGSRDSGGLNTLKAKSLSQVLRNSPNNVSDFLKLSLTDNTIQCSSFSYWVDEPTMTQPGVIHYKSNAGLANIHNLNMLEYGTANTNILSLSGNYSGVAYNMTNMNFSSIGFDLDGSGNSIAQSTKVVNSWSSSLADVFQTVNIINDINALASQFSEDFSITIPGSVKQYDVAQPVTLLVMVGNTISPITGIYNIVSVSHAIKDTFITTLKIQRLTISSANSVASGSGIFVSGSNVYPSSSYTQTSNIITPYKVDFGTLYPDFTYLGGLLI